MMKYFYILTFIFILIYTTSCTISENKDGTTRRVVKLLNDGWYFAPDSLMIGEELDWYFSDKKPISARVVTLPHTWNVEEETEDFYGTSWYFKAFKISDGWKNKIIRLKFHAIYRDVKIWLNGNLLENRVGAGYTSFEIDISETALFGAENFLAVEVSNQYSNLAIPFMNKFDWPNDGGIIRDVELIKTDPPSIQYVHVNPHFKRDGTGKVFIEIGLLGGLSGLAKNIDAWYRIAEFNKPTSNLLLEGNQKLKVYDSKCELELDVAHIKPWHFNRPNLYELSLAIGEKMILTDNFKTNFGFRTLITEGSKLLLNGEPVRLPGLEWMPGSYPDKGMAESKEQMDKMLNLLKNTNAVLTRFHWQQDDYILDWCDKNGILVQEEVPLWQWPDAIHIDDTIKSIASLHAREMVMNHYNHPSIVAWGIGNELSAQDGTVKDLIEFVSKEIKNIDSSRLINYVSNTLQHDPTNDGTNIGDVIMWNDYTGLWYSQSENGLTKEMLPGLLDEFNRSSGNKPIIISEYGLCEPVFKGGDPRRIDLMKYHTSVYEQKPFVAGAIYFSLNDYRTHMGEEGEEKFRRRVHGIVDIEGNKKPSYDSLRKIFSPIKALNVDLINDKLYVKGRNHDGIPYYTLNGYRIIISTLISEQIIDEKEIHSTLPGTMFNVVFNGFHDREFRINIYAPNDFCILEKDYNLQQ